MNRKISIDPGQTMEFPYGAPTAIGQTVALPGSLGLLVQVRPLHALNISIEPEPLEPAIVKINEHLTKPWSVRDIETRNGRAVDYPDPPMSNEALRRLEAMYREAGWSVSDDRDEDGCPIRWIFKPEAYYKSMKGKKQP